MTTVIKGTCLVWLGISLLLLCMPTSHRNWEHIESIWKDFSVVLGLQVVAGAFILFLKPC